MARLNESLAEQIADAYRQMARAGYRPEAPSDGFGNITGPLDLAAELERFIPDWWAQEEAQRYRIGCPDWHDRRALIWTIAAAQLICAVERTVSVKLLRMAADDLKARS
jgi:hypothetical protein